MDCVWCLVRIGNMFKSKETYILPAAASVSYSRHCAKRNVRAAGRSGARGHKYYYLLS